jgi:hypothetical protein
MLPQPPRLSVTWRSIKIVVGTIGKNPSMQERVRLVNGKISIESKPLAGTTIHACVPLGAERDYKANGTSCGQ